MLSARPWLADHPHARRAYDPTNTIYVAADRMSLDGATVPAAGAFDQFDARLVLSASRRGSKSVWCLPTFLSPPSGRVLSYHVDPDRWSPHGAMWLLKTVGRGQEFVIDVGEDPEAMEWVRDIVA
jgi:hypothetical protein